MGALGVENAFVLDDSVRRWRRPDVAQMATGTDVVPLGHVLTFLEEMLADRKYKGYSMIGFPRNNFEHAVAINTCWPPELTNAHVYSGVLINVKRVYREQGLNYRQDLFLWEDIEFNSRVASVWKCKSFSMEKTPFPTGGCCAFVARRPIADETEGIDFETGTAPLEVSNAPLVD